MDLFCKILLLKIHLVNNPKPVLEKLHIRWLYFWSFLFIAITALFIAKEQYWILALPMAAMLVLLYIYALDKLMLFILFATPLSTPFLHSPLSLPLLSLPPLPLIF